MRINACPAAVPNALWLFGYTAIFLAVAVQSYYREETKTFS